MSYNISSWKTKKLDCLRIPLEALQYSEDKKKRGWKTKMSIEDFDEGVLKVSVHISEIGGVTGTLLFDTKEIEVEQIAIMGEGSGTDYHELLIPALEKSTGELEAILIWEGGDSITFLRAASGTVTDEPYDL